MVTIEEIRSYADRIAQEFRPQRIVLFGSYAYGTPTEDSDVDILVVMPHQGKPWDAATEIRLRVKPRFPLDLIVRSPEVLERRLAQEDYFLREVVERGMVLHAAGNA